MILSPLSRACCEMTFVACLGFSLSRLLLLLLLAAAAAAAAAAAEGEMPLDPLSIVSEHIHGLL